MIDAFAAGMQETVSQVVVTQDPPRTDLPVTRVEDVVVTGRRQSVVRLSDQDIEDLLLEDLGDVLRELRRRGPSGEPPALFINGRRVSGRTGLSDLPAEAVESASLRQTASGPELRVELAPTFAGGRAVGRADVADDAWRLNGETGWTRTTPTLVVNLVAEQRADRLVVPCAEPGLDARAQRLSIGLTDLTRPEGQSSGSLELRRNRIAASGVVSHEDGLDLGLSWSDALRGGGTWMASVNGATGRSRLDDGLVETEQERHHLHAEWRVDGLRPLQGGPETSAAITVERGWGSDEDRFRTVAETRLTWAADDRPWSIRLDLATAVAGAPERRLAVDATWRVGPRLSLSATLARRDASAEFGESDTRARLVGLLPGREPGTGMEILAFTGADADLEPLTDETASLRVTATPFQQHDLEIEGVLSQTSSLGSLASLGTDVEAWAHLFPERLVRDGDRLIARLGPFSLRERTSRTLALRLRFARGETQEGGRLEVLGRAGWSLRSSAITREGRRLDDGQLQTALGASDLSPTAGLAVVWRTPGQVAVAEVAHRSQGTPEVNLRVQKRVTVGGTRLTVGVGIDNLAGASEPWIADRGLTPFDGEPRVWFSLRWAADRPQ